MHRFVKPADSFLLALKQQSACNREFRGYRVFSLCPFKPLLSPAQTNPNHFYRDKTVFSQGRSPQRSHACVSSVDSAVLVPNFSQMLQRVLMSWDCKYLSIFCTAKTSLQKGKQSCIKGPTTDIIFFSLVAFSEIRYDTWKMNTPIPRTELFSCYRVQ